jgi:mannose-6-phosphate isomerase-like protein (cupin superfamily)
MRTILLTTVLAAAIAGTAFAQSASPPPMKTFTTSAEVTALIAQAKAQIKEGQPMVGLPILSLAPYRAGLEYRAGNQPPSVHEKDLEMFYVIEGTGTLITGGKLDNEKRNNAANLGGTGISGGKSQAIAKGDFFVVPENTPHQIMPTGGAPIVLMAFHAPRPAANWP